MSAPSTDVLAAKCSQGRGSSRRRRPWVVGTTHLAHSACATGEDAEHALRSAHGARQHVAVLGLWYQRRPPHARVDQCEHLLWRGAAKRGRRPDPHLYKRAVAPLASYGSEHFRQAVGRMHRIPYEAHPPEALPMADARYVQPRPGHWALQACRVRAHEESKHERRLPSRCRLRGRAHQAEIVRGGAQRQRAARRGGNAGAPPPPRLRTSPRGGAASW
eukprot:5853842-Prymnesium_polylepis.1